jgi:hypothetical protein
MIITLTIYSVILLLIYNLNNTHKLMDIDKETLFMYLLVGGWIVIFAYNIYKLKESKKALLTMSDILPLLYQVIGLIVAIGVLIIIADNLLGGKITR